MYKPPACIGCSLYDRGRSFSEPDGLGTLGVVAIGEALGHWEAIEGKPFFPKAQAGSMLMRVLRMMGISREQLYYWNIVACQPPNNRLLGPPKKGKTGWEDYAVGAINHCKTHFDRVIGGFQTNKTKTLLGLGNVPLLALSGFTGSVKSNESISHLRGYVLTTKYGPLVLSYHPSYLQRGNAKLIPAMMYDIRKAINVASGLYTNYLGGPGYREPAYNIAPSLDDLTSMYYRCRDNSRMLIGVDIETPYSRNIDEEEKELDTSRDITLTQFSTGKNTAIAAPYRDGYIKIIDAMLRLPNPKMGHNIWEFDQPRLYAKGHTINGPVHDTMYMFKHWHPGLERGLQKVASIFGFPFPWKHLFNKSLEWYGCADVDSLFYIVEGLIPLMKSQGIWHGYVNEVFQLRNIMVKASERGIPVNETKRVALRTEFQKRRDEKDAELQARVPTEARNVTPRRKNKETGVVSYGYKRTPKLVTNAFSRYQILKDANPHRKMVDFATYLYRLHNLQYWRFDDEIDPETGHPVCRFVNVKPFKASNQQLGNYIKWKHQDLKRQGKDNEAKLYKVPTTSKGKETTSAKELEMLYQETGDGVLQLVGRLRSLDVNLNNFLPNWEPHADGRVHPMFGYLPFTGQTTSKGPNVQNCSKHTEYGQEFRGTVEAPEGYTFLEADYSRFHIATMGYCSNDPTYINFGRLDCHSIFTSYVMGEPIDMSLPEGEIRERVKYIKSKYKKERDEKYKHVVLGNQLGLGPDKLYKQHRLAINGVSEAKQLQDMIADMYPKPALFKEQIREKAYLPPHCLINDWGRIAYFFEVFRNVYNKKTNCWKREHGKDSERVIAWPVQSIAFGMMFWNMLELERLGYNAKYSFFNTIHDSLQFLVRLNQVDNCIADVYPLLVRPCTVLKKECCPDGLQVGVDISIGRNWRAWDATTNPEGMREIKV